MSKPHISPYRRNAYNNNIASRSPYRDQSSKLTQKSKLSHSVIADNPTAQKLRTNHTPEHLYRGTQKKYQNTYNNIPSYANPRLQTLLQQNKYLLSENNQLSNIVNERSRMVLALQKKLQEQISQEVQTLEQIQFEKNRFLEEYSMKIREQNRQNQRLMDQIAQLNEDIYQLQVCKSKQIETLKATLTQQHRKQLEHILTTHSQSMDLMNLQLNKNKSELADRDQQIVQYQNDIKILKQQMAFTQNQLNKKLAHNKHIHTLQLSQQKLNYEAKISSIQKDLEQINQLNTHQLEGQIGSLKKQLNAKNNQVSVLNTQLLVTDVQKENYMQDLQTRIAQLEAEIISNEEQFRNKLTLERSNLNKTSQVELQANQKCYEQMIQNLKNQTERLMQIIDAKTQEIIKLNETLENERERRSAIKRDAEYKEKILKEAHDEDKQAKDQEDQALKVKMAHLRKADLEAIRNYYDNQMAVMTQQMKQKDQIIAMNRQKVHLELQQKNQMRKQFQIQILKLKGRIGQLELKIAGLILQRKQQISNIQSRIQVTSMTLVRQSDQKSKYAKFAHGEKVQLQDLIKGKDKQIQQLFDKIRMMSQNHQKEIEKKDQELALLRKNLEGVGLQLKKQKLFLEKEIQKKARIHQNDKEYYQSEITRIKKEHFQDYSAMNNQLTNQRNILEDTKQRLIRENTELKQKLSQVLQSHEQLGLQNETALHQTKTDLLNSKSLLEFSLKNYYETQIDTKNKQIEQLKAQIKELNADIRMGKERQGKLQDKISKLVRGEQKLREMEEKVMALGQQNNIIKNLADIVKRKEKKI